MSTQRTVSRTPLAIQVSDDPGNILGEFLSCVVTTPRFTPDEIASLLMPDGEGFWAPYIAYAWPIQDVDDIPAEFLEEREVTDFLGQDLWVVCRERRDLPGANLIIRGKELRELVNRAYEVWAAK